MNRRGVIKFSGLILGSAVSLSVCNALLSGVRTGASQDFPSFSKEHMAALYLLSDMIIPPTDTPGAVEAGVPEFISTIVFQWYTDTERDIFFEGLNALDQFCLARASQPFHLSPEVARNEALLDQERIANDYVSPQQGFLVAKPEADEHAPFFKKIRELVVLGYYTSEVGSTQELAYRPVPGEYNGDYEFAKVGRLWSH